MSQIFFFCTLYDGNATFVYKYSISIDIFIIYLINLCKLRTKGVKPIRSCVVAEDVALLALRSTQSGPSGIFGKILPSTS